MILISQFMAGSLKKDFEVKETLCGKPRMSRGLPPRVCGVLVERVGRKKMGREQDNLVETASLQYLFLNSSG